MSTISNRTKKAVTSHISIINNYCADHTSTTRHDNRVVIIESESQLFMIPSSGGVVSEAELTVKSQLIQELIKSHCISSNATVKVTSDGIIITNNNDYKDYGIFVKEIRTNDTVFNKIVKSYRQKIYA